MMRIRVCDDDSYNRDTWVSDIRKAIGDGADYEVATMDDPASAVGELLERQTALRDKDQNRPDLECEFDSADILVVDYDLVLVDAKKARHTGEEFARLARLYADVKYIVVMNQGNRSADFDLTMTGRPQSYADLNIPAKTVGRPGLWRGVSPGEFRPWQWDNIPVLCKVRSELVEALAADDCLNGTILSFLGMPKSAIERLSDQAYEFLDPLARTPQDLAAVTFAAFLERTTEHRDVEALLVQRRNRAASIAVARLGKWMARMLLGPQDVLVDIPHLLQRCPFLLDPEGGPVSSIDTWNGILTRGLLAVAEPIRKTCSFASAEKWLGRPALWWTEIEAQPFFEESRANFDFSKMADVVFAEDTSRFIPFESATEYRAGFYNQHDHRFIEQLKGVEYGPSRRLVFD